MGAAGAGKSTLGRALAARLGWRFEEGDDLHSAENIARMTAGSPLTDDDRAPWLDRVRAWIDQRLSLGQSGVITCSALKRAYRQRLGAGRPDVVLVYIEADRRLLRERLRQRRDHFMPPALLPSQLAVLEKPSGDERAIVVQAGARPEEQLQRVIDALDGR